MNRDYQALLKFVVKYPTNTLARRVLADWLEDRGAHRAAKKHRRWADMLDQSEIYRWKARGVKISVYAGVFRGRRFKLNNRGEMIFFPKAVRVSFPPVFYQKVKKAPKQLFKS